MLATWDLAARPAWTLLWLGLGFLGLAWGARSLPPGRGVGGLLGVAALLRLLLLPLPPSLSEDVRRYLWDGRVAAAGLNPYLLPASSPRLAHLRDGRWEALPHRDVPTVYPPVAVALFSIAARFPAPLAVWKGLLAAADLGGCLLLVRLARRVGVPTARAVWYAWNPLVVLETAGMGHVDALGIAMSVGAVCLLAPRRAAGGAGGEGEEAAAVPAAASSAAAAAAVLVKLAPLATLPLWARCSRRPALYAAICAGVLGLALAPVLAATGGLPPGLVAYAVSWEFNGPLHEPLWRALDALGASDAAGRGLDLLKQGTGRHDFWNRFYPYRYPQLLARVALAAGLGAALIGAWRATPLVAATGRVFGALILFSPTVYPWYVLWVLPWAALTGGRAWIALSALLPLTYLPALVPGLRYFPWIYLAVWGPFFAFLLARRGRPWSSG